VEVLVDAGSSSDVSEPVSKFQLVDVAIGKQDSNQAGLVVGRCKDTLEIADFGLDLVV
jgi:hypothetical protein